MAKEKDEERKPLVSNRKYPSIWIPVLALATALGVVLSTGLVVAKAGAAA
ncbi:MAG: hypothetical protein LBK95_19065 [Bifidobacteriaceae bacterium]|jgi:hypothetical protein|nr:hypothetical protein [Bifidobacteriaceae bacterium]